MQTLSASDLLVLSSAASSKRFSTLQFAVRIFDESLVQQLRPCVIFSGVGLHISNSETAAYHADVDVMFQKKVFCILVFIFQQPLVNFYEI